MNIIQAGSLLKSVKETTPPTMETITASFKNLALHGEENPNTSVQGMTKFVTWMQSKLNELEERRLSGQSEASATNTEPDTATQMSQGEQISFGICQGAYNLLSESRAEAVQRYENRHPAIRSIAEVSGARKNGALYVERVSDEFIVI